MKSRGVRQSAGGLFSLAWAFPLAAIVLLFGFQLAALLEHRVDYPVADDWRYYLPEYEMPATLSLAWVLAPARDTVHASGKLIDWLIFRHFAHDYRALATVSFSLFLGGWLAISLRLVFAIAGRRPAALFASLALFCLPLAGVPYWVTTSPLQRLEPAIAYHQMLPVVGLVALALLSNGARAGWGRGVAPTIAALITCAFALSYSSGAVVLLAYGATTLGLWWICRRRSIELPSEHVPIALATATVALACLLLHIALPLFELGVNPIVQERTDGMSYSLPNRQEFWLFLLGLFDRSSGSTAVGWAADLRGAAIAGVFVLPAFGLSALLSRGVVPFEDRARAVALVAILLATTAYAVLVSYGRAEFGNWYVGQDGPLGASLYARNRFFFWWIAAALPFALIAWGVWLEWWLSRRVASAVVILLMLALLWPKPAYRNGALAYFGQWSYSSLYARDARKVRRHVDFDVQNAHAGKSSTPMVSHLSKDVRRLYERADQQGAEFVARHGLLGAPPSREPWLRRRAHPARQHEPHGRTPGESRRSLGLRRSTKPRSQGRPAAEAGHREGAGAR